MPLQDLRRFSAEDDQQDDPWEDEQDEPNDDRDDVAGRVVTLTGALHVGVSYLKVCELDRLARGGGVGVEQLGEPCRDLRR